MTQTLQKMSASGTIPQSLHQIALLGYGVVGQGLFQIIKNDLRSKFHLKGISIRDKVKARNIPHFHFQNTSTDLIQNPDVESIIEATDDSDFSWKMLLIAANLGKNYISANKKMVAANLTKIIHLQDKEDISILYEASTAGAIPIIRTLDSYFAEEPIVKLRGIINGSSNYILSKIFLEGKGFQEALDEAIEQGFAESDPLFDLNGSDVQSKLIILGLHAFGVIADESEVFFSGIEHLSQTEIEYAREKNCRIRLLANAETNQDGGVSIFVLPSLVQESDSFFSINAELNAIQIEGKYSGNHLFSGKGAGSYPTASALISDLHACSDGFKYKYSKYRKDGAKHIDDQKVISAYFRFSDSGQFDIADFESIQSKKTCKEGLIVEGKIKLASLLSNSKFKDEEIFIMQLPFNLF
jgi:homoserine dehydrogenase